jgi:hypothetical protein
MTQIRFGSIGNIQNNTNTYSAALSQGKGQGNIIPIRVLDIILDNTHPKFKEYGEWNSIGIIFFEQTNYATSVIPDSTIPNTVAFPLFPNIKQYPLINELTYIIYLPGNNLTENNNSLVAFYLPPTNVWNSQHHNAVPVAGAISPDQNRDYTQTSLGSVRKVTDNSTEIYLGKTFKEKINIHPLLPYEGDVIYEGRWGNSIRLGSTVKNAKIPNNWSSVGENGDPILILRNGQSNYKSDPWVPETEQINGDQSSIYLSSTQKLPISPSSDLGNSFAKSTPPQSVNQYNKNQIVLNSGRLVFNSKSDSIILGSNQSIHLTAEKIVGIDGGNQIVLAAPKVYLGSAQGTEGVDIQSVVLGEDLNSLLGDIAVFLSTLNIAFSTAIDSMGVPIASLSTIAADAQTLSQDILNQVNGKTLLSKQVKTS